MKRAPRILAAILLFCIISSMSFNSLNIKAEIPYKTYTLDGYGIITETQAAYTPHSTITKIGDLSLSEPRDMTISEDGHLYIADTGNRRIIKADIEGNFISEFGTDTLIYPSGLYVTGDNEVFVADRDAKKVFVFNEEGELIGQYEKPNHPLYGDGLEFKPLKIVVNKAGNMYIICEANTNGIVQISPTENGSFLGYFGTNYSKVSISQIIKRMVLTDTQRAKMVSNTPSTPDNLAIDSQGLIYTVTRGDGEKTLKKLNIAGVNLIQPQAYDAYPTAITTGNYDNIFMVSSQGYIYEFNNEGELLFVFGGSDDGRQRIGLSKKAEAISVGSNDMIYLLDSDMNQIHIFAPTEFTRLLHNALHLYTKGRYTESKEPLEEVLRMNSLFDYANQAMGRAYLQEENYDMALHYSKLAKDYYNYSDAFWETRNIWLRENLITMIGVVILVYVAIKAISHLHRKYKIFDIFINKSKSIREKRIYQQFKYSFYYIKNPVDGSYGVRWEDKSSLLNANILIIIFMFFSIINKYFSGFLLKTVREGRYDLVSDIGTILGIFIMFTACNYLICTINDGEGTFKQIYSGFAYSLTPFIIIQPINFVLSHMVTYNEVFFIKFLTVIMVSWIGILLFMSIKEIHNYSVKETIKVIGLTLFAALIAVLLIFILYVLWKQVIDFVIAISGEVVYRIGF